MVRFRARTNNFWVGFIILLAISILFPLIGVTILKDNQELIKNGTPSTATIVDMVKHTTKKSVAYYPVVEYLTATGERIRVESSSGASPSATKVGQKVNIIYSNSDPRNFIFDKFFDKYGAPAIFIFAGVLCFFINVLQTVRKIRYRA